MKTTDLIKQFNLITEDYNRSIDGVIISDMLSVVMRDGDENNILVTVQNNVNSVAVANLLQLGCIIICCGFEASEEMLEKASEHKITMFETELSGVEVIMKLKTLGAL